MGAVTKAELEAMVKRLQRSRDRAEAKITTLDQSLERARAKNKTLAKSLNEALEREKATAEILRIIRRSPTDTQPVFEEFRQVGTHAEGKAQGTGLGLALTKKFIELHGGKIWLTSTLGQGSTFSFTLPITQPAAQAESAN